MRRLRSALLLAAPLLLPSCRDKGPTAPKHVPGTVTVTIAGVQPGDGALLLAIAGPDSVAQVTAANAAYLVRSRAGAGQAKVAVFGTLGAGALVRFNIRDIQTVGGYSATVLEVADTSNALRANVAGYTLTVAR